MTEVQDAPQEEQVINRNDAAVVGQPDVVDRPDVEITEQGGNGGEPSEANPEGDIANESTAQAADEGIKSDNVDVAKKTLEMFSKEPDDLNKELTRLKKSKEPKDQALAAEFEIAQKKMELVELESQIARSANKGLSETQKNRMERKKEELKGEINSIGEQREGITNEGVAIPNQIESLTRKLGITETNNPLGDITSEFKQLLKMDPKQRKETYVRYGESGMTEDETKFLEDAIKAIGNKERLTHIGNIAKKIGAGSLIFMIIMMIKSFKESNEGGSPRQ